MSPARDKLRAERLAAIDLGKARVGLAVADDLGMLAHPRPALSGRSEKRLLVALCALSRAEGVTRFLVGMPLHLGGEPSAAHQRVARFCQKLADATGCEIELLDERWTTVEAARRLRERGANEDELKAGVDSAAAAILLQQRLDALRASRRSR